METGAISLKAFCERFSISDNKAYREIAAGRLKAVKVGRRTLVSEKAAAEWLDSLPALNLSREDAETGDHKRPVPDPVSDAERIPDADGA